MKERAKIIAEQALSLPADDREELLVALAVSLGRHPYGYQGEDDGAVPDEDKQYLKEAWDKGVASGPGKYASIEEIIGEARSRAAGGR
ncbi:MAG: hypothetical protein WAN43_05945 [Rhodomicrobium sp.]